MHIWIIWWSWRIGKEIIIQGLNEWHTISTLVRNPPKIESDMAHKINVLQWDGTNKKDIKKLLNTWIEILIHTVSVWFFHAKPTDIYSRVTEAVISARWVSDHHCKHYMVMSSSGTHHGRSLPFPFQYAYEYFLGDVADDKEKEESLLEKSSLPRTVIKAIVLNNNEKIAYKTTLFENYSPSVFRTISRKAIAQAFIEMMWKREKMKSKIVIS